MKRTTKLRSQKTGLWVLVVLLGSSLAFINPWVSAEEVRVERTALKGLPSRIGDWQQRGMDERFDATSEDVLHSDDYLLRGYALPSGEATSLFVGYYTNLEFNSNFHSPTVCLPGAGWTIIERPSARITPGDRYPDFDANSYVVQRAGERFLMIFWYQGRGRFSPSDFWTKVYTTLDGIQRHRADGAIVRVLVPIKDSEEKALASARRFAAEIVPPLSPFVPE